MSNWLSSAQVDRIRRLLRSGREDFGTPSTCGLQIINGAAPTAGIECSGAKSAAQLGVSRRRFLASVLSAGAVAATVDLEQLIWTPSTQIVVPTPLDPWEHHLALLNITRMDVFDKYEFSWKMVSSLGMDPKEVLVPKGTISFHSKGMVIRG